MTREQAEKWLKNLKLIVAGQIARQEYPAIEEEIVAALTAAGAEGIRPAITAKPFTVRDEYAGTEAAWLPVTNWKLLRKGDEVRDVQGEAIYILDKFENDFWKTTNPNVGCFTEDRWLYRRPAKPVEQKTILCPACNGTGSVMNVMDDVSWKGTKEGECCAGVYQQDLTGEQTSGGTVTVEPLPTDDGTEAVCPTCGYGKDDCSYCSNSFHLPAKPVEQDTTDDRIAANQAAGMSDLTAEGPSRLEFEISRAAFHAVQIMTGDARRDCGFVDIVKNAIRKVVQSMPQPALVAGELF